MSSKLLSSAGDSIHTVDFAGVKGGNVAVFDSPGNCAATPRFKKTATPPTLASPLCPSAALRSLCPVAGNLVTHYTPGNTPLFLQPWQVHCVLWLFDACVLWLGTW